MKKTLIALAAAATLAASFASTAKADAVGFNFGVDGTGQPHFGFAVESGYAYPLPPPPPPVVYAPPVYDAGYDDEQDSCGWVRVKKVRWNWSHTVRYVTWGKQWVCDSNY